MKMPSAFAITINQFSFISVSSQFFCSRRMGWPYPSKQVFLENGMHEYEMEKGIERKIKPVIRLPINQSGTLIFQAIIPPEIYDLRNEQYKSEFILNTRLDKYPNTSKIHIQNQSNQVEILFNKKDTKWIPDALHLDSNKFVNFSATEVLKIQNFLWLEATKMDFNNKDAKKTFTRLYHLVKEFNLLQIQNLEK